MAKGSQFFTNCSNLTADDLIAINLSFSGTGAVCCFISTIIFLLLLICRAYKTVLQRLFLYLMVATAMRELLIAASLEHHFKYHGQDKVCTWVAFLYNWTGILLFVFTVGILIYLFFLVQYVAKGNTVPHILQSKRRRVSLEILYIVVPSILTFAYASVPYFTHNYGLAGAWCWIRALDDNCKMTLSGLLAQLFHGHIFYEAGGIIGIILTVAVAVVYYRLPISLQEARKLIRKTFVVMICFLLSVIAVVIALSIRMITAKASIYRHFAIWFSVGVTYPSSLLLFPVAFLVSFYPISKLSRYSVYNRAKKCLCFLCKKKKKYSVRFGKVPGYSTHAVSTAPMSTRVSAPSNTFFKVQYTNAFTHITTESALLCHHEEPLDTGYGSSKTF